MPRLKSWADWFWAYPMTEADIAENIEYTAKNIRTAPLAKDELKVEITLNKFQFRVRESRQQNSA